MGRRTSARQWFNSLGRRHESLGVPMPPYRNAWPLWARKAYCLGRLEQNENGPMK